MLSHLVGSANRVDLARLAKLECELGHQVEKVIRQEVRLQTASSERSTLLRRIECLEAERLCTRSSEGAEVGTTNSGSEIASLLQKLGDEKLHATVLTDRLGQAEVQLRIAAQRETRLTEQADALKAEVAALEGVLGSTTEARVTVGMSECDLHGRTLLYVGGRPKLIDQLRAFTTRRGGLLLTHDGGVKDNLALLPGLISQSATVFFPVDCVSHTAAGKVKKLCRDADKPFTALRSASLASFVAAVAKTELSPPREE